MVMLLAETPLQCVVISRKIHGVVFGGYDLIAELITISILNRNGSLVLTPSPERYAIHMLIALGRRTNCEAAQKALKTSAQAEILTLMRAEEGPFALAEAKGRGFETRALYGPLRRIQHWRRCSRQQD